MARYIARKCPRCRDYFGVTVSQQPTSDGDHPISAFCAVCGFALRGWRLIVTEKRPPLIYGGSFFSQLCAASVPQAMFDLMPKKDDPLDDLQGGSE